MADWYRQRDWWILPKTSRARDPVSAHIVPGPRLAWIQENFLPSEHWLECVPNVCASSKTVRRPAVAATKRFFLQERGFRFGCKHHQASGSIGIIGRYRAVAADEIEQLRSGRDEASLRAKAWEAAKEDKTLALASGRYRTQSFCPDYCGRPCRQVMRRPYHT